MALGVSLGELAFLFLCSVDTHSCGFPCQAVPTYPDEEGGVTGFIGESIGESRAC